MLAKLDRNRCKGGVDSCPPRKRTTTSTEVSSQSATSPRQHWDRRSSWRSPNSGTRKGLWLEGDKPEEEEGRSQSAIE
ncbi:MAG: hypothetical protein HC881_19570 [Leptolyngbyaceae cyanobacterium SL_7_1]|nr:hypothetical protein [Leptolyngbyaceae cyanobacterium SL_7_1]